MQNIKLLLPIFFILLVLTPPSRAETFVTQRIQSLNRLIPLQKVTVGPDDQYHGALSPSGKTLVFTRKSNLAPHLCSQDLETGKVRDLISPSADSQEAVFSPPQSTPERIAFTYYKFNAQGDICYQDPHLFGDEHIQCLPKQEGEQSTPFWKSENELGYLVRDLQTGDSRILITHLKTGETQTLVAGKIWYPAMKAGGRFLFYNELIDSQRVLVLKDLKTGKSKILHWDLPGISGFPSVSEDENTLYFSHYLNDTNQDGIIDGNDHSVIFRAPIPLLLDTHQFFPEQLTSVENNCSFPRVHAQNLFVTCAFEGSLDIYQLPQTGTVPIHWGEKNLLNAHQTARSYADRILLLNTLKYRLPTYRTTQTEERILSNHFLAKDFTATEYYLQKMQSQVTDTQLKNLYLLLAVHNQAQQKKNLQPSNEITKEFKKVITSLESLAEKISKQGPHSRLASLIQGFLKYDLNRFQESYALLQKIKWSTPPLPIERILYFELAQALLPKLKISDKLISLYLQMSVLPELSEESQLYYAFELLKHLQDSGQSRDERISILKKIVTAPPSVLTLFQSEVATLTLIQAQSDSAKDEAYRPLDQFMSNTRGNYFLRKALYIRAILNFAEAAEFRFLGFVATNWLRYTTREDTEFAYGREVYSQATLDRAYDTLSQKKLDLAGNYFYGSLSLTDDLESHSGYVRTMLQKNQRKVLTERYHTLLERKMIEEHYQFIEALLILLDSEPQGANVSQLDAAINLLESLHTATQDSDAATRYLLSGYCRLKKLLLTADGYDVKIDLLEKSHRDLMLAYDLGRDLTRIKASALINLGILHQRAQNHGLALKYLTLRKEIPFLSVNDQTHWIWAYTKSLFYMNQSEQAAKSLQDFLSTKATQSSNVLPPPTRMALADRLAFYWLAAEKFESALSVYDNLLTQYTPTTGNDLNLAKIYLAHGFSHFKLKHPKEAKNSFQKALSYIQKLKTLPKGGSRLIDFQPARLELNTLGLLATLSSPSDAYPLLKRRLELLKENPGFYEDQDELILKTMFQIAHLPGLSPERSHHILHETLPEIEKISEKGQSLSKSFSQSLLNILTYAIEQPHFKPEPKQLQSLVDRYLKAYDTLKSQTTPLKLQRIKLDLLWEAYLSKKVLNRKPNFSAIREKMNKDTELPTSAIQEIQKLMKVL